VCFLFDFIRLDVIKQKKTCKISKKRYIFVGAFIGQNTPKSEKKYANYKMFVLEISHVLPYTSTTEYCYR